MNSKKIIERELKFTDKYTYLSTRRGNLIDGDSCMCDNCGKLISNIVNVVRHSDKRHFYIGTDCAETLSKAKVLFNNGAASDFYVDMYTLATVNRFVTQYNKTPELVDNDGFKAFIVITEMKDGKAKAKEFSCYIKDIQTFQPDIYRRITSA